MAEHFEYINLKDKKLRGRPVLEWVLYYEPTERLILWIIANCKEAFNPKHFLQYAKSTNPQDPNDHKLKKHLEFLQSLKANQFIRQDNELNYYVTKRGQLRRLTTHPQWIFIQVGLPLAAVITFGVINCNNSKLKTDKEQDPKRPNEQRIDPSFQYDTSHTLRMTDSGSSLTPTDTFSKILDGQSPKTMVDTTTAKPNE